MYFILGIIVLQISLVIMWSVACKKIENKSSLLFVVYMTYVIVVIIICTCFVNPRIKELEDKVNELTTELYESYNVRDSLEQEK